MTDSLKPCPFCGADSQHYDIYQDGHVVCTDCHAAGPWGELGTDEGGELWNTRHHDAMIRLVHEAADKLLDENPSDLSARLNHFRLGIAALRDALAAKLEGGG